MAGSDGTSSIDVPSSDSISSCPDVISSRRASAVSMSKIVASPFSLAEAIVNVWSFVEWLAGVSAESDETFYFGAVLIVSNSTDKANF